MASQLFLQQSLNDNSKGMSYDSKIIWNRLYFVILKEITFQTTASSELGWPNITHLHQSFLKLLWIPDIFIDDVKKIKKYRLNNDYEGIIYWGDKYLVYYAVIEVVMYCPMVFEDYPLDSQICHFMLQSYHHRIPTLTFRHYAQITYCPKIDIIAKFSN